MKSTRNTKSADIVTPLYCHVFYGRFTSMVVFILLASFMLQPIDRAYADELPTEPATPAPIDTSTSSETARAAGDSSVPEVVAESAAEVPATGELSESSELVEVPTSTETVEESEENSPITTAPEVFATDNETGSDEPSDTNDTPEDTPEEAELLDESIGSSTATTTGEIVEVKATVTSDSQIQFAKSDCIAVADGSYYCRVKTAAEAVVKDGLYSQSDSDGDLEIFFAEGGVLQQISHNTVDDASPYFDALSNTIVWHRLIDDRYQIISYDIDSGSESQITTDTVNNMEPTRAGKYIVWQHWNDSNWDIMLYDGSSVTLLTDTPQHDIAPTIRGNLVIWNRLTSDNVQTIELYDLTTKEFTSINDNEGGALSNPRMVLVYEAQFENGDVVTKGYDVLTGEITALSSIPAALPENIPEPDSTGETRALIQAKNSTREEGEQSLVPDTKIDPPNPGIGSSTASSTLTLDLQTGTSTATSTPVVTPVFTLDLSATSTTGIQESDVVIPPFVAATTTPAAL